LIRRRTLPPNLSRIHIAELAQLEGSAADDVTVQPSESFEVIDRVAESSELEKLGVEWPDCAIFGLLDVLMFTELGPLYKVCVVLEKVWYHDVDSTFQAFRHAGRAAGRKIVEGIRDDTDGSQLDLVLG
jgi:hypothetical protein